MQTLNEFSQGLGDFFENSLNGYAITDRRGHLLKINATLAGWLGLPDRQVDYGRFSEKLSIGGRIYFETHLWPLLLMQGYFDEVAVEIRLADQSKMPVLINAQQRKDAEGQPSEIWITVFKATDRQIYEQNLKTSKAALENNLVDANLLAGLKDQFIAILGHDLRNPLGAIMAGTSMLSLAALSELDQRVVKVIDRSAHRMEELIGNIMDFARTRLGDGLVIDRQLTMMHPVLEQVVAELQSANPQREIISKFDFSEPVLCDGPRVGQLVSNLLANAITHGDTTKPVIIAASRSNNAFEITVTNSGRQIPPALIEKLFLPFTRESERSSQNGLGLGLYIASQIAKAHEGELSVASSEVETSFTLRIFE